MKGIQHVIVSNRDAKFEFDLYRNITIVRGKSGTGKTTLYEMVADYTRLNDKSGVNVSSPKNCVALIYSDWKNQLINTNDSIVFIDEGAEYLKSKDFAEAIRNTSNYYVIFNRENLYELPYSVEEIYEIKTSGKYHRFEKYYRSKENHFYGKNKLPQKKHFDVLLTEDSKSGLQFYRNYFKDTGIQCFSSGSNSAIFKWLKENKKKNILVVADGAAFGSEIDRVLKFASGKSIWLCLPESFEWLILNSGIIKEPDVKLVLKNPSEHVESAENFSWEIFFEKYLINITNGKYYQYSKSRLAEFYKSQSNAEKIISEIYADNI